MSSDHPQSKVIDVPSTVASPAKSWERMPEEPDKWYNYFMAYLELGPTRTIKDAVTKVNGKAPKRASGTCVSIAKHWKWVSRALDYDTNFRKQCLEESESVRKKTEHEHDQNFLKAHKMIGEMFDSNTGLEKNRSLACQTVGRGKVGEFLINSHKVLYGEKSENKTQIDFRAVVVEFKPV